MIHGVRNFLNMHHAATLVVAAWKLCGLIVGHQMLQRLMSGKELLPCICCKEFWLIHMIHYYILVMPDLNWQNKLQPESNSCRDLLRHRPAPFRSGTTSQPELNGALA